MHENDEQREARKANEGGTLAERFQLRAGLNGMIDPHPFLPSISPKAPMTNSVGDRSQLGAVSK